MISNGSFARTPEQEERLRLIGKAADEMKIGAHETDLANGFSHRHIELLREIGYPGWTVPKEYGGAEISLYEFLLYQERLAQGDPAIALGMGWHLSVVFELAVRRPWSEAALERVFRSAVAGGLTNRANSEKATGSPSRGGQYQTKAKRSAQGGYVLNGRKTFTTLSPVLDTAIVGVTLEEEGEHADFLIPMSAPGVSVDPTWNVMGMRGTGSHDLALDNVELPADALVFRASQKAGPTVNPYLLHIPACYLGIALAARAEAIAFAESYQPNTLDRPILYAPNIGQQIAAIDLELSAARHYMYSAAARYEESDGDPSYWLAELGAVKVFAVQTALSVVDKALRIAGAHGLSQTHPLQRLYRDVRFGLSNPPMEDSVMRLIHQRAILEVERQKG
ncbi:acyl-CoA dehydrogenase family protein [Cohnella thailandensis]|uniref:Acyl-CoA/acyl-ACP dehydrogenase n=1 Tax=Cohnella thailandensis TaxID=557557 RepID=A0A841SME5_9BACL|nr:acyl-CoA dehydrogenase family protein [Cohnella thailandensis]MBB6633104.1 acyl-CoA/acyl-ACP dehydrogenase [Cohnella thailandensis]MBP1975201.1 alkylation response protein AidB-like acyl-CoA dehydrogenase [Cohnella thailandensis]